MLDGSKANVVEAAVEGEVGEGEGGVGEEGGKGGREEGGKERRQVDKCLREMMRSVLHQLSFSNILHQEIHMKIGNPNEKNVYTIFLTDLHQIGRLWQRLQQR